MRSAVVLGCSALLIVVAAACASASSSGSSTTTISAPVTTVIGTSTLTVAPTTTLGSPPPTAVTTTTTSAATTGSCKSSDLQLTLGDTEGAMGNQYTPIIFTNTGRTVCTLDGHPGVSFLDVAGNQVGASAERVTGSTPTVTLAPGARAHATIDYHDPGFFDDSRADAHDFTPGVPP